MTEKNPRLAGTRSRAVAALLLALSASLAPAGPSAAGVQRRHAARRHAANRRPRVAYEAETYAPCNTRVRASEVLIKFKRAVSLDRVKTFVGSSVTDRTYKVERVGSGSTLYLVHITGMRVSDLTAALTLARNKLRLTDADEFDFEYIEPNFILHKELTPNDPDFRDQWALRDASVAGIKAESAWDTSTGSADILVGVVDTGITYDHPDLTDNAWHALKDFDISVGSAPAPVRCHTGDHGFNAIDNNCDPRDLDSGGHGTVVSGIIGAKGNNSGGVTGVNWTVGVVGLRALDGVHDPMSATVNAIEFAVEFNRQADPPDTRKIRVLNNSYGYVTTKDDRCRPRSLEQAIHDADDAGILFVASAGSTDNDNDVNPHYPSGLGVRNIISVTGINRAGGLGVHFNHGVTSVDMAAPGAAIKSTGPSGFTLASGTSVAAAFVSGSAALILSACPRLTPVELKSCILNNADVIPWLGGSVGGGRRLNLNRAITACRCGS
jgi:subtilisin family serine protease